MIPSNRLSSLDPFVGMIGLAETLVALSHHHGQNKDSEELGLEIIKHIKEKVDEFCERFDLNYTFLATPAEGLSGSVCQNG